jgi:hypothetical protein
MDAPGRGRRGFQWYIACGLRRAASTTALVQDLNNSSRK